MGESGLVISRPTYQICCGSSLRHSSPSTAPLSDQTDLDMTTPAGSGCVPFLDDRRKAQNRLAQRRRRRMVTSSGNPVVNERSTDLSSREESRCRWRQCRGCCTTHGELFGDPSAKQRINAVNAILPRLGIARRVSRGVGPCPALGQPGSLRGTAELALSADGATGINNADDGRSREPPSHAQSLA